MMDGLSLTEWAAKRLFGLKGPGEFEPGEWYCEPINDFWLGNVGPMMESDDFGETWRPATPGPPGKSFGVVTKVDHAAKTITVGGPLPTHKGRSR